MLMCLFWLFEYRATLSSNLATEVLLKRSELLVNKKSTFFCEIIRELDSSVLQWIELI